MKRFLAELRFAIGGLVAVLSCEEGNKEHQDRVSYTYKVSSGNFRRELAVMTANRDKFRESFVKQTNLRIKYQRTLIRLKEHLRVNHEFISETLEGRTDEDS